MELKFMFKYKCSHFLQLLVKEVPKTLFYCHVKLNSDITLLNS